MQTIRLMKRRWRFIAAFACAGALAGYLSATIAKDTTPQVVAVSRYAAKHTLILNQTAGSNGIVFNFAQISQRVTKGDILEDVAKRVNLSPNEAGLRMRILIRGDSMTLELTGLGETSEEAVSLADAMGDATLERLASEMQTHFDEQVKLAADQVAAAERNLAEVRNNLTAARARNASKDEISLLEADESLYGSLRMSASQDLARLKNAGPGVLPLDTLQRAQPIEITESAYLSARGEAAAGANVYLVQPGQEAVGFRDASGANASPLPASPPARGLVGLVLGSLLAVGIILALERFDQHLKTKADVESFLDTTVIAEIPALSRRQQRETKMLAHDEPLSRHAEAFRVLRSSIDFAINRAQDAKPRGHAPRGEVILVTSPGPSEGKTTTVANLACVLAEANRTVLVINCDFRRPRVQQYLKVDDRPEAVHETEVPGVRVVTHVMAESPHVTPADVVAAQRSVIERSRGHFDVVLLDTAPVLTTNDATEVLSVADHVVLVVNANKTTRESAARAMELLSRRHAPLIGVAFLGGEDQAASSYYYYDGDNGYLQSSNRRRASNDRKGRIRSDATSSARRTKSDDDARGSAAVSPPRPVRARDNHGAERHASDPDFDWTLESRR